MEWKTMKNVSNRYVTVRRRLLWDVSSGSSTQGKSACNPDNWENAGIGVSVTNVRKEKTFRQPMIRPRMWILSCTLCNVAKQNGEELSGGAITIDVITGCQVEAAGFL